MKFSFGTNSLPASSSYNQRESYAENYSEGYSQHSSVNYWYEHMRYGRIDYTNQDVILPKDSSIQTLDGAEDVSAINFAASAFNSMGAEINQRILDGTIPSNGNGFLSSGLIVKRGYRSPRQDYLTFMSQLYDNSLFPFLISPGVNNDILNFYDFIEQFSLFIERFTLLQPYTMTEYIISNLATPLYSGLAIEIDDTLDHGEDFPKITNYINDPHFEIYRQIAANNGIILDKNAPWRLVARPGATQIAGAMANYNTSAETMVDDLYDRAHTFDIPDLKSYMRSFYDSFVTSKPTVHVPLIEGSTKRKGLTKVFQRATMSNEEYQQQWLSDDPFWIRLYIYVRAKETNRDWNQYKFEQVVTKATQFLQYSGETAAYKFINKEVKRPYGEEKFVGRYRRGNFRFQRK